MKGGGVNRKTRGMDGLGLEKRGKGSLVHRGQRLGLRGGDSPNGGDLAHNRSKEERTPPSLLEDEPQSHLL